MNRFPRFSYIVATAITTTVLAGCSSEAPVAAGELADATAVPDKTFDVGMSDSLVYDPPAIEVATGDTVLFRVVNDGQTRHEFTLGDRTKQLEHADEMATMDDGMTMDDVNVVSLAAGESGDIMWTFTEPGTYEFACHEPGHFEAGMIGTITVAG